MSEGEYEVVDEGSEDYDDEEDMMEKMEEIARKSAPKQTKTERERSEASAFLLANKERVREMGNDEVGPEEFADLQSVRGPIPQRQETTAEYLDEFSDVMVRYNKDLRTVGEAVGANRVTPDEPPYPFLPPDFAKKLVSLTPSEVRRWAMMCDAYTEANNAMEDVMAGGELVKEGLALGSRILETLSRDQFEMNVDGLSMKIRARLAGQKPLTMRLFRKYVEPALDRMTGGNGAGSSDLLALGMLFYGEFDKQYEENKVRARAREALMDAGGAPPPPPTRHEQMAEAVNREIRSEPEPEPEPHKFEPETEAPPAPEAPKPVAPEAPGEPKKAFSFAGGGGEALEIWKKAAGVQ